MNSPQYTSPHDMAGYTQDAHAIAKGQRERRLLREQREAEQRQSREEAK